MTILTEGSSVCGLGEVFGHLPVDIEPGRKGERGRKGGTTVRGSMGKENVNTQSSWEADALRHALFP